MKKLFVAILALGALASCQKENVEIVTDNETKTISLTILNEGDGTRAEGGNTAVGTSGTCADAKDLVVLFADIEGVILHHDRLTATDATDDTHAGTGTSYVKDDKTGSYMWHMVPADVKKIAVVRVQGTEADSFTTLKEYFDLAGDEAKNLNRELKDIVLYGEGTLSDTGTTHRVGSVVYHVWSTSVTVEPKFARLEVRGIKCTNLGNANKDTYKDAEGNDKLDLTTYGFDELLLNSLVWESTTSADAYYTAPDFGTQRLYGLYNPSYAENQYDYVAGAARGTNEYNPTNGAWSWNVLPCTFEKMVLAIDAYAYDYAFTDGNRSFPLTVGGLGTGKLDENGNPVVDNVLTAGNIYVLNLEFTEGNISAQDQICVDVTVVINPWTVVNRTPIYQ